MNGQVHAYLKGFSNQFVVTTKEKNFKKNISSDTENEQ